MKVWIGIDNGVSGSIGIIREDGTYHLYHTPVTKEKNYQKKAQNITRVDGVALSEILYSYGNDKEVKLLIERPLVNPGRFKATLSAMRSLEATLIVLDILHIDYTFTDSRLWQHMLLPEGTEKEQLKPESLILGKKMFPKIDWEGGKFKDADALLLAEYCKRTT